MYTYMHTYIYILHTYTQVPVGDQPSNIAEIIREMVYEVIQKPNCIILAVSAANQDIANSDGLQVCTCLSFMSFCMCLSFTIDAHIQICVYVNIYTCVHMCAYIYICEAFFCMGWLRLVGSLKL